MDKGLKRAITVWHRRSGKDKVGLNFLITRMFKENEPYGRVGTFYHLFPTYAQAKKAVWDGIDKDGFRVIDHFPPGLVEKVSESELQVTLKNGSIYQLIGTDNIDRVVGTNPAGCVFSEYALQNPRAWDLLRPILAENDGWAIFNTTPRGHNHAKHMYDAALNDPAWYCSLLTVDDTEAVTKEQIEKERHGPQPMSEELIQQEFYCSFEGFQEGSYYVKQLRRAREDRRITRVPWISTLPVFTFWDIGIGDETAIWFGQVVGDNINLIDYYEQSGEGIAYYAKFLKDKPYTYARHYWPHDGANRSWSTGTTRLETALGLGIKPIDVVPRGAIDDGIEAVRSIFSVCRFDETKCSRGIDCLTEYHKERDDVLQVFKDKPLHNWASNGADAFRTMAKSDVRTASRMTPDQGQQITRFDARYIDDQRLGEALPIWDPRS